MRTARDAALASHAALQHGTFSRRQASDLGFTPKMIRSRVSSGAWIQLSACVFAIAGSSDSIERRRWSAILEAGGRSALSHGTAAAVLGLPGFDTPTVNVLRHETRHHELTLSRLHCTAWLPDEHVVWRDRLPVTSIARLIFDLAGDPDPHVWRSERLLAIHERRIKRAFDTSLARLGNSIDAQAAVVAALARRGRPGSALMRRIMADATSGYRPTESELEDLFLEVCAAFDLEAPERQPVLGLDEPVGRVDFLFRACKLVVEVDGRPFHDAEGDAEADRWRDIRLAAAGYRIMRIRWHDLVHRADEVVRAIRACLRTAA